MPDSALTLWYTFAESKSLAAEGGLGPTLGIVRATEATYFDSAGVLQTAASGEARFDHNPATGESLGLLVEPLRTNICLQSEDVTTTWTSENITLVANTDVAPDGNSTADTLTDASAGAFGLINQTITIADDNAVYTFSVFIKKTSSAIFGVNYRLLGGTTEVNAFGRFQPSTNTFNSSAPADAVSEDVGDYYRISWSITNNTSGNTTMQLILQPAVRSTIDGGDDATVTGSQVIWGVQVEAGTFPTSYIPTTSSAVQRNADVPNTNDVSWVNQSAGTLYIRVTPLDITQEYDFVSLNDTTFQESHYLRIKDGDGTAVANSRDGNVDQYDMSSAAALSVDTESILVSAWELNNVAAYVDGAEMSGSPDIAATMPTVTSFGLASGGPGFGGDFATYCIAEIRYYNERKADAFLTDLSNGLISERAVSRVSGLGFKYGVSM